jgi:peroxin-14
VRATFANQRPLLTLHAVLQDPSVAGSPVENRIAFLQSKNLTQEEVDAALARASGETIPSNFNSFLPQQQVSRQTQPGYGGFQPNSWQQPAPPEVPKRDWRDWFIMATVMGGVGYGLYFVAKVIFSPLSEHDHTNLLLAIRLSDHCTTYSSSTGAR